MTIVDKNHNNDQLLYDTIHRNRPGMSWRNLAMHLNEHTIYAHDQRSPWTRKSLWIWYYRYRPAKQYRAVLRDAKRKHDAMLKIMLAVYLADSSDDVHYRAADALHNAGYRTTPRGAAITHRWVYQTYYRMHMLPSLDEGARPRIRADCVNGLRPCPWVSCRYHLWLDITRQGRLTTANVDLEMMPETCALDVADYNALNLDAIGQVIGCSRERVRQIYRHAMAQIEATNPRVAEWLDNIYDATRTTKRPRADRVHAVLTQAR